MAEQYIESMIIRDDNRDPVGTPTIPDEDVDAEFDIRVYATLVGINKSVSNTVDNRATYMFKINTINRLEKV